MGELKEFLQLKSVPQELSMRVVNFHERLFSNRTVFDEGKIMSRLPQSLRKDVVGLSRVLRLKSTHGF